MHKMLQILWITEACQTVRVPRVVGIGKLSLTLGVRKYARGMLAVIPRGPLTGLVLELGFIKNIQVHNNTERENNCICWCQTLYGMT